MSEHEIMTPEAVRLAKLEEMAESAKSFIQKYNAKVDEYRLPGEDGEIDPAQFEAYDTMRADWGEVAVQMLDSLGLLARSE